MQARWHEDGDKCAFIILARDLVDSGADEVNFERSLTQYV